MKHFIVLLHLLILLLFSTSTFSQNTKLKFMVIVNNPIVKSAPSSKASSVQYDISFGSILFADQIIKNNDDFDFIVVKNFKTGKKIYVPREMTQEFPIKTDTKTGNEITGSSPFVPETVVPLNRSLCYKGEEVYINKSMKSDLYQLITHAREKGFHLSVVKGYVPLPQRIKAYENALAKNPKQNVVESPLKSKYSSGDYLDITDSVTGPDYTEYIKNPKAWEWLSKNCNSYGFSLSNDATSLHYTGEKKLSKLFITQYPQLIDKQIKIGSICQINIFKEKHFTQASFIWVHHNEKSAGKTLDYALKKYGGHSISIINSNKRNVYIHYRSRYYAIDPNRIYTVKGIDRYMRKYYPRTSRSVRQAVINKASRISSEIISQFEWDPSKYLIALHSSKPDSKFSINEYNQKNAYLTYKNPSQNPKNLFYTISLKDYYFFKSNRYNAVYQRTAEDDGSLSVYAASKGLPYINIEVEEGLEEEQRKMLDLAIDCINQNYKKRSL